MKYEHYREDEKIAFINLIKQIVSESTLLEEDILVCEGLFSTNVIHHGECILTISWLDLGTRVCAVIKPNKRVDTTEVTKICYIFECYLGPVCVNLERCSKDGSRISRLGFVFSRHLQRLIQSKKAL